MPFYWENWVGEVKWLACLQVPPKPCTKGLLSQASGERSRVLGPTQSPLPRAEFNTSVWSQGSKYDSVPPARLTHLQLPPPPHTHQSQGLVSELPSWPQSELLTPVPDEQARLWLESQNVLPHSFHDLTYTLLLTCWGKSPWPRQQVYCKVTIS